MRAGDQLKLMPCMRVETENRYLEAGTGFVSVFMIVAWNALLNYRKGESQTAKKVLSFDSRMRATLFIFLLLADTKRVKVTATSKD